MTYECKVVFLFAIICVTVSLTNANPGACSNQTDCDTLGNVIGINGLLCLRYSECTDGLGLCSCDPYKEYADYSRVATEGWVFCTKALILKAGESCIAINVSRICEDVDARCQMCVDTKSGPTSCRKVEYISKSHNENIVRNATGPQLEEIGCTVDGDCRNHGSVCEILTGCSVGECQCDRRKYFHNSTSGSCQLANIHALGQTCTKGVEADVCPYDQHYLGSECRECSADKTVRCRRLETKQDDDDDGGADDDGSDKDKSTATTPSVCQPQLATIVAVAVCVLSHE